MRTRIVIGLVVLLTASALVAEQGAPPPPKNIALTQLPDLKNWSLIASSEDALPELDFTVDLDLLAPLGTSGGNAATYFVAFSKDGGPRFKELAAITKLAVPDIGQTYGAREPLLLESEPWADRPLLRFYPESIPLRGITTAMPNLLHFMDLARSWRARAAAAPDAEAAKEDCRRIVRLGRLLRQDQAVAIQDLVGLALIKMGAEGLYEIARKEGDAATMLVATMAHAEASGMREAIRSGLSAIAAGHDTKVSDERLQRIDREARSSKYRPLPVEAATALWVVANTGTADQRTKAKEALDRLAADSDTLVSQFAKSTIATKWNPSVFKRESID